MGREGKHYYDFTSGIGVNALGYCDEGWVKAVTEQAGKIQHMSNYYYCDKNTQLAELLAKNSGLCRSFFCNSGAEANECAVKIARKYGEKKHAYKIVTLENSFHGRTLTTLAATGQDGFHRLFTPLTEGFVYAKGNDVEDLKAKLSDPEVCAVLLESVQGEGGVVPMEEDYLKAVRALCTERDVLMMLDEVQTGIGRTGYFFSYQRAGILPDVVTAAKGLGDRRMHRGRESKGQLCPRHERLHVRCKPRGVRRCGGGRFPRIQAGILKKSAGKRGVFQRAAA